MSNSYWLADGGMDRQAAFVIGPPRNAAGAGDDAGAAAEVAGDQASRVSPFPANLTPGQKVGNSRYENFRPQVHGSQDVGRYGDRAAGLASDGDDLRPFGTTMADNLDNNC